VWLYDLKGEAPRQIFRGWAANHAWAGASELFVVEGMPDLRAILWRVRLDGSPPVQTRTSLRLNLALPDVSTPAAANYFRFDVHPDHKRIVVEAFRFQESDISMIENIR
jgi:hypothetical protein